MQTVPFDPVLALETLHSEQHSAESQGASEAADALLFASTFWNFIWFCWLVLDNVDTAKLPNAPRLVVDAKALCDLLIKEEVQAGTGS